MEYPDPDLGWSIFFLRYFRMQRSWRGFSGHSRLSSSHLASFCRFGGAGDRRVSDPDRRELYLVRDGTVPGRSPPIQKDEQPVAIDACVPGGLDRRPVSAVFYRAVGHGTQLDRFALFDETAHPARGHHRHMGAVFLVGWFASTFNTVWEEGFDLHKAKWPVALFDGALVAVMLWGGIRMVFIAPSPGTVKLDRSWSACPKTTCSIPISTCPKALSSSKREVPAVVAPGAG